MTARGVAMPIIRALTTLALFLALHAPASATDSLFVEAADFLNGVWIGNGSVLRVDAARAQASADPARPFLWDRFIVKEVTNDEIVFAIGAELFEARIDDDTIAVTSTSFRGERVMFRELPEAELRGTAD